jgi:hypothetical protein
MGLGQGTGSSLEAKGTGRAGAVRWCQQYITCCDGIAMCLHAWPCQQHVTWVPQATRLLPECRAYAELPRKHHDRTHWCRAHFVNPRAMRKAVDIHTQVGGACLC